MNASDKQAYDLALSRGWDRGNYANAYETQDFDAALKAIAVPHEHEAHADAYRAAFTIAFFASYELEEMAHHADTFRLTLAGDHGQRCIELGWIDTYGQPEEQDPDAEWPHGRCSLD